MSLGSRGTCATCSIDALGPQAGQRQPKSGARCDGAENGGLPRHVNPTSASQSVLIFPCPVPALGGPGYGWFLLILPPFIPSSTFLFYYLTPQVQPSLPHFNHSIPPKWFLPFGLFPPEFSLNSYHRLINFPEMLWSCTHSDLKLLMTPLA
jgi:hypothetical protein